MELLTDFAYLSRGKTETFLESTFAVVFTKSVLIAVAGVLDADSKELTIFEDAILYGVFAVVPTDALESSAHVFPDRQYLIFLQDETIFSSSVEALFVAIEAIIFSDSDDDGFVPWYLFLIVKHADGIFHEFYEKFLHGVHIFGEMLF